MTARLVHIYRHPIKSHGREELARVTLAAGGTLPWDRHWAVTHGASKWDAAQPAWADCVNFIIGAKVPALVAINARLDDATARVTLTHPLLAPLTFAPDEPAGVEAFMAWVAPLMPQERQPVALVTAPDRAMTDSDFPSVSVCNLASGHQLGRDLGVDLSPLRWRGNLWVDGWEPWAEQALVGRDLRMGDVVLHLVEPIRRCKATMANPATGLRDVDTLQGLRDHAGAQNFGLYAVVKQGGVLRTGDMVEVLE